MSLTPILTKEKISDYLQKNIQPGDFIFAGAISSDWGTAIKCAEAASASHRKYLHAEFDNIFLDFDWAKSFLQQTVILTEENIVTEAIIELHYWLRSKNCNIKNIHLITSSQLGTREWWDSWTSCMNQVSFNVIDTLIDNTLYSKYYNHMMSMSPAEMLADMQTHVCKQFSYFGGTYQKDERDYLCLMLAADFYNTALIDYQGVFNSKQHILDYVENISYFSDQDSIDLVSASYDCYVNQNKFINNFDSVDSSFQHDEPINFAGLQWEIDRRCIFSIARETSMEDVLGGASEKTFRALAHWKCLIPVGYRSVEYLRNFGFWFPDEIFDYSYQYEKDWHTRIKKIKKSLLQNMQEYSISDMIDFIHRNQQHFVKNASLIKELYQRTIPLC